ncbi:MAG: tetratricopeptide repeat protein [Betaproteobacteria bacterium]|nr:tetratricopeptide repeat protein [Betaproteobacteria bacterium]
MNDSHELDALLTRAAAAAAAGRIDEAVEGYQRALVLAPANARLHHNIGVALSRRGDLAGAESHLLEAERLDPTSPVSSLAVGHLCFNAGRMGDAARAFERALRRAPDSFEASCNLGLSLQALGESARALPMLAHARERLPSAEVLFRAHFEALQALGRIEEADQAFLAFEAAAAPSAWLAATGLFWARTSVHAELEAKYLAMAASLEYALPDLRWLSKIMQSIQYFDVTREQMARLYRRYDALMQQLAGSAVATREASAGHDGRLRVGYLSNDFRRHVMGELILRLFSSHDRGRFEIFAYSLLPEAAEDTLTATIRRCCDCYINIAALSDSAAAERIARDGLDLLVDLASHTPQARPGILLRKPAAVIVAHLGDHGSIGLRQVDFKVTDAVADLPDAVRYQVETPLAMQGCVMPFRRVTPAPADPGGRARLQIPADAVVFGVFAAAIKLSARGLGLWRRIIESVPHAYLALSPFTKAELVRCSRRLRAAGVPADRIIVIQPSADDAINRARYRYVDILLDTLPYTGGDSTVAALDMGVPVVTRAGERQAERIGLSLLSQLGVTDTVASSDDEYVAIACRLATDAAWRSSLSVRIVEGITASGIADFERYTRRLEDAFERALALKHSDRPRRGPQAAGGPPAASRQNGS